ncbi:spermine synthase [Hanstruepera neustonica]|uniref:Spermine synthase n=1 Tax=Hanstruepera neustonica TaxID=1445657 RepID=A0A2K1E2U7_9FLAO|nr:fused MFS/spermidine synthase [Hanstruepera neustonica]PNQ74616.1 spermine synthase [Hanstruepera neustonica]
MVRLLSYLYPITRKVKSDTNGMLEITWYNGKKLLNSKNANYSYGSLQEILKFGLEQIDMTRIKSVLLLGIGGGSVIQTLRDDFNYQNIITAVDIDSEIIKIALEEFNLQSDNNLEIVCEDALEFVQKNSNQFDLIIIDLFIDTEVPEPFYEPSFWEEILKIKTTSGTILFNASLEKSMTKKLQQVISFLKSRVYKVDVFEAVNNTNTVVITKSI